MTGNIVTLLRLPTTDVQLREELLERIDDIVDNVIDLEPGTKKYAAFVPREDDGKTVWLIEEYVNQAAYEAHANSDPAQRLQAWLRSVPIFSEANPPVVLTLQYLGGDFFFSRPELKQHPDPHVIFAELDYVPGGVDKAAPYWKEVVATGRENEPGTLLYGVMRDMEQEEKLATFGAYESPEYFKDIHMPNDAISANMSDTKSPRTGLKHYLLRKVVGFLYKDE